MNLAEELEAVVTDVNLLRSKRTGRGVDYPKSFKKRVAALIADGQCQRKIHQVTGISKVTLAKWATRYIPEPVIEEQDLLPIHEIAGVESDQEPKKLSIQVTCLRVEVAPPDFGTTLHEALRALGGRS